MAVPPPALDRHESVESSFIPNFNNRVATVILPGSEPCDDLMLRGGIELTWRTENGRTVNVNRFRQHKMRQIVDQDMALPTLYLHLLDAEFRLREDEINTTLRSGNDNSELHLVLPTSAKPNVDDDLKYFFDIVWDFLLSQGEVMSSPLESKAGGFSPKQNFKATLNPDRLYFTLRTARPKADVNLDKAKFGIPETAQMYLFAENHHSVGYMSESEHEAFSTCIMEMPNYEETQKLAVFVKFFYEGGFGYNQKLESGEGYLPKNVALACMGVVPAFPEQAGIATGWPYRVPAKFLSFVDTVPVSIGAIRDMSSSPQRHQRYGICFTRSVFVWDEEDRLSAPGANAVLNYASILPHGGFYYVPQTWQEYSRLGALVYAFGEERAAALDAALAVGGHIATANTTNIAPTGFSLAQSGNYTAILDAALASAVPPVEPVRQLCVICLENDATHAAVPCGHRAFCSSAECQTGVTRGKSCPICRKKVTSMMRIYD